ncbi:MAG: hypothetical protein DMF42_06220 [Verrucomicrobia bacterium]|nr:MAG: hypothetical protein DMF42_06220 [Verrucomicrobiota bacterium]
MPEPLDKIFAHYPSGEQTTGAVAKPSTPETAIEVEEQKYGIAKVKRSRLRAQIIRDQNGTS